MKEAKEAALLLETEEKKAQAVLGTTTGAGENAGVDAGSLSTLSGGLDNIGSIVAGLGSLVDGGDGEESGTEGSSDSGSEAGSEEEGEDDGEPKSTSEFTYVIDAICNERYGATRGGKKGKK